ncbi:diphosphomevalonate decarboxylase [Brochothrix campestris]|uniref:diphosphomevalonate decarboxylase n=1 Tax=Brochothrix campestris FSL F6-1037 TaxID=1265861 RepID=W7CM63_9LIST|nr:diphosphomevalonate decarboxylase [Brochothrix campestris]EUJ37740.1 mevalonate diphosphate decarboxylase [Brochothrix campestris FSL F6-1037]
MKATAIAHTNIALIKYWGKRDKTLILPANSSLSMTLDQFYTETTVEWSDAFMTDQFTLNGSRIEDTKVTRFLTILRQQFGMTEKAHVTSTNHVPTAAGLASSASAFAALALAASKAAGREDDDETLSRLARLGSGSASRSIFGDFALWQKGTDDTGIDSYAYPVVAPTELDLAMVVAVVDAGPKKIDSRLGMQSTVETSPYFEAWTATAEKDLLTIQDAFKANDFKIIGETVERNALSMHATTMAATPPFSYLKPASFAIMETVHALRENGIEAYFTMDAGPNVKVLCLTKDEQQVQTALASHTDQVYICHPGPKARVIAHD